MGEIEKKPIFLKIAEKEYFLVKSQFFDNFLRIDQQILRISVFCEKIPRLSRFSLKMRINDTIGDKALRMFIRMLDTVSFDSHKKFLVNFESKCEESLLWSAPEFVFKTFFEPFEKKNENPEGFLFNFEHFFSRNIDSGVTERDFEQILSVFLRRFPLVEIASLHVKVLSWMNLSDSALKGLVSLLRQYGKNLEDLQIFFSGFFPLYKFMRNSS